MHNIKEKILHIALYLAMAAGFVYAVYWIGEQKIETVYSGIHNEEQSNQKLAFLLQNKPIRCTPGSIDNYPSLSVWENGQVTENDLRININCEPILTEVQKVVLANLAETTHPISLLVRGKISVTKHNEIINNLHLFLALGCIAGLLAGILINALLNSTGPMKLSAWSVLLLVAPTVMMLDIYSGVGLGIGLTCGIYFAYFFLNIFHTMSETD